VLFSHTKSAPTTRQSAVLFSQSKSTSVTHGQPNRVINKWRDDNWSGLQRGSYQTTTCTSPHQKLSDMQLQLIERCQGKLLVKTGSSWKHGLGLGEHGRWQLLSQERPQESAERSVRNAAPARRHVVSIQTSIKPWDGVPTACDGWHVRVA